MKHTLEHFAVTKEGLRALQKERVKRARELYLEGFSYAEIGQRLNREGIIVTEGQISVVVSKLDPKSKRRAAINRQKRKEENMDERYEWLREFEIEVPRGKKSPST